MGMCGIFATTNDKNSAQTILSGLKKLEYRGYDSWGIAVKSRSKLRLQKQIGKISVSQTSLPQSSMGIGHTRWATHGGVTVANAHPHLDCTGKLALIHNGIVDNYENLGKKIKGHQLLGQTDSEIIVHLIERELTKTQDLLSAVKKVARMAAGFNAFVVLHQDYPYLVAAKTGFPFFMLKEIYDQPAVLTKIAESKVKEARQLANSIAKAKNVFAVACGTASYAALAGQYLFARIAGQPVIPAIGSEFYYYGGAIGTRSLCLALSQSGETIDTLQSVGFAKSRGARTVSLVNVRGSSLDRLSDQTILLEAGRKSGGQYQGFSRQGGHFALTASALTRKTPRRSSK